MFLKNKNFILKKFSFSINQCSWIFFIRINIKKWKYEQFLLVTSERIEQSNSSTYSMMFTSSLFITLSSFPYHNSFFTLNQHIIVMWRSSQPPICWHNNNTMSELNAQKLRALEMFHFHLNQTNLNGLFLIREKILHISLFFSNWKYL
jgi:hypothetical protein